MEIYKNTGVTKTPELRVTKGIGALIVKTDMPFAELTNERINVQIERGNGNNEVIMTNILLSAFVATSVFGEGDIIENSEGFYALCEIANDGVVPLQETEKIVITMTGLKSAKTYELHGIEMPVAAENLVFFDEKSLLKGEKNKYFDVEKYDEAALIGDFDKVRLTYPTDEGIKITEYSKLEIRAIAADIGLTRVGSNTQIDMTLISVVGVSSIEFFAKPAPNDNQVNIILRDVDRQ